MSGTVLDPLSGLCGKCGSSYRPSPWGREYLCPACGLPLSASAHKTSFRLPGWIPVAALAVVLTGGIVWVSVERARAARLAVSPPPLVLRPAELPPHFQEHLLQKVALLRDDLQRDPTHPALLTELARTYLALAKLSEERDPQAMGAYLRLVVRCISRITETSPGDAARLEWAVHDFKNLTWVGPGDLPGRTVLGPANPGPLVPDSRPPNGPPPGLPPPVSGGNTPVFSPGGGAGMPGVPPGMSGGPSFPPGMSGGPGFPPGAPPGLPLAMPGGAPLPPGGAPPPVAVRTDPDKPFGTEVKRHRPHSPERELRALRRQVAENPDEVRYADQLGLRLTQEGYRARRDSLDGGEHGRAYFREARDVYMAAADRARLHIHRSAFLFAAADLYSLLGDAKSERRVLEEATELTPFSLPIWVRLQSAYLRNGMITESRRARQEIAEWSFPRLRPKQ